jgi:glycosyltransferase involved in cell wall biosynthesis
VPESRIPVTARPMRQRDIDVCFTGNIMPHRSPDDPNPFGALTHNPIRQDIYERTEKLKERYNVFCLNDRVDPAEYFELLQRSKLVVCTESFGCETWRHYEASAAGAVPLINWPYATNYMPFQPDLHAIYFSLIGDDFERTVARALADPAKLAEISVATRAFTLAHKERKHVGEMVIEETLAESKKLEVRS